MEAMNKDWFENSKGLVDKDTIIFPLQPPGAKQDCHDNDTSCFVIPNEISLVAFTVYFVNLIIDL
ncbi:hypothetical protein GIHI108528_00005 [Gillisia hiemivivida]